LADLDRVYGIKPGVDTAWNMIPFSFVADYFANMGDVLHNVDAFSKDGLVMPYGYVMRHRIVEYNVQHLYSLTDENGVFRNRMASSRISYETKQRLPANPFGFGLDTDGLSVRQGSILAALGINRK
jgi:hypothetical protein